MNFISRNTLILCFLSLTINIAFIRTAQARNDHAFSLPNDFLLVINTYTADAPWSNAIIEPVQKWISAERDFAVFAEHLNMLFINDTVEFNKVADSFLSKYTERAPKGVLLLGNSALLMKDKIRNQWGDIPLILCAEMDFFGPDRYYINRQAIPEEERVPLSVLAEDYNITVLQTKMFPRENVKLMKGMIPGLKEVLLIGDGRYVSQQLNYDIKRMMKQEYPELKYRFLSAADLSLEELMSLLEKNRYYFDRCAFFFLVSEIGYRWHSYSQCKFIPCDCQPLRPGIRSEKCSDE